MEKIRIENFKKIKDECELNLAPITFLTGTNNSGKSTIIKATLLLQDYFRSNDLFNLNFNGNHKEKHRINSINDILNYSNKINEKYNSSFTTENTSSKITISTKKGSIEKLSILNKKDNIDFTLKRNIHSVEESWDYKLNFNPNNNTRRILTSNAFDKIQSEIASLKLKLEKIRRENNKLEFKKIGRIVKETMREILADYPNGEVSDLHDFKIKHYNYSSRGMYDPKEIVYKGTQALCNKQLSKKIFDVNFPVLKSITKDGDIIQDERTRDDKGYLRYYKERFKSNDENCDFLLTSQWYDRYKSKYFDWLKSIKYKGLKYYMSDLNDEQISQSFYEEARLKGQILNLEEKLESIKILHEPIPDHTEQIECVEGNIPQTYINDSMQASSITGDTPNWILFNDLKKNATKIFNRNKRAHEIKDIENINQKIDRNFQSALNYEISHLSTNRFNGNKYQEGNKIECELDHLLLNKSVGNFKEKFIEKWMTREKFNLGFSFQVEKLKHDNFQLGSYVKIFKTKDKKDSEYLSDQGYGSGQIFTILYKIATILEENKWNINDLSSLVKGEPSKINHTLIIEEPETNLHPKLQSKLAELFYEVNKKYGIRFIIETHSEYLIRKTESIAHREKLYSYDDSNILPKEFPFKVIYLSEEGAKDMGYLNGGGFRNEFGTGFFDEATKISIDNINLSEDK